MRKVLFVSLITSRLFAGDLEMAMADLKQGHYQAAADVFYRLAKEGNFIAQQNLGVMYNNGLGLKKNYDKASQWFDRENQQWKASESAMLTSYVSSSHTLPYKVHPIGCNCGKGHGITIQN